MKSYLPFFDLGIIIEKVFTQRRMRSLLFFIFVKKDETMKAIEINTKTDKHGHLKINYPINQHESNVRVIILIDEKNDDIDEEEL